MRLLLLVASAIAAFLGVASAAQACSTAAGHCRTPALVFPAYTPEGYRLGTIVAPLRLTSRLDRSRITGQPLPVIYDNPDRVPGSVDPDVVLMPLPRVKPSRAQAVYLQGY